MTLWGNVSLVGESVTVCYTTVVKTVQIHDVYGYIVFEGWSYPALRVIIDNHHGSFKYTTYINKWMTRQQCGILY